MSTPKRILLVRNDRMGDFLMTLPAISAVRRQFPQAHLTVLVLKGVEPLLENYAEVDQIWIWEPNRGAGWLQLLRWVHQLRRERFDWAIIFNPTQFFHLATCIAAIPTRVGYNRKAGRCLTHKIVDTKVQRDLHEAQYNLELLDLLGVPTANAQLRLVPSQEQKKELQELLFSLSAQVKGVAPIAIHPWTSNPEKSWPLEAFSQLMTALDQQGRPLWILGGPEEASQPKFWKTHEGSHIHDLVGQIPLRLLPALLEHSQLLVSNDSGPVHVAAAVATPTLVVAPKHHEKLLKRWQPIGDQHQLLLDPEVGTVLEAIHQLSEKTNSVRPS